MKVNKSFIKQLQNLSTRKELAQRIADFEGIKYESAMRRLQRYVTEGKEKRNIVKSTKLESVRDKVPYKKIQEKLAKEKAKQVAKQTVKKASKPAKATPAKATQKLAEKFAEPDIPKTITGLELLKKAVAQGKGIRVEVRATFIVSSDIKDDERTRTINFRLSAEDAKKMQWHLSRAKTETKRVNKFCEQLMKTDEGSFLSKVAQVQYIDFLELIDK